MLSKMPLMNEFRNCDLKRDEACACRWSKQSCHGGSRRAARMGDDPATSVVDPFGRSHDVPNLFIVDGSTFVTSGGVNPTNTICALALRCAAHIVGAAGLQRVPA